MRFYAVHLLLYFHRLIVNGSAGYTIDPAYASFTDNELGSLEVGKRADFVVLSQDVMKVIISKALSSSLSTNEATVQVAIEDMMATKVLATAIDGEVVYGSL